VRVPGTERAVVAIEKLRDYCLDSEHPRGRHKARVFAATLGLTMEHTDRLREALLFAAKTYDATLGEQDSFGQRYTVDFPMEGLIGTALVRSARIIRSGEDFPRLVSCYVASPE
jgi:hypothetical protein